MNKKERLNKIIEVISKYEIETQEQLTDKLNELGLNVSQSTVSRDINELKLIKIEGIEKKSKFFHVKNYCEGVPENIKLLFKHIVLSIVVANNLVVIKTLSGNGSSAGMAVDSMGIPQVLGSIAGDDTLVVIAKTNSDAEIIKNTLRSFNA